jgi:hypothetical protein
MSAAAFADYAYTFQVPVSVSNLPAGSSVQVECNMWAGPNHTGAQVAAGTSTTIAAPNGSYSGTLTVKDTATTAPGSYACWVMVWLGNSAINLTNGNPPGPAPSWTGTMVISANLP